MRLFSLSLLLSNYIRRNGSRGVSSRLTISNLSHFHGRHFQLCGLPPLLYLCDLHVMSAAILELEGFISLSF
jgi:hypothetical protein